MGLMNKVNQIDENFSYSSDDNKVSYFTVMQDLMTIKTILSYQPRLYLYFRDRKIFDFPLSK